jgi:hypothetical protein
MCRTTGTWTFRCKNVSDSSFISAATVTQAMRSPEQQEVSVGSSAGTSDDESINENEHEGWFDLRKGNEDAFARQVQLFGMFMEDFWPILAYLCAQDEYALLTHQLEKELCQLESSIDEQQEGRCDDKTGLDRSNSSQDCVMEAPGEVEIEIEWASPDSTS